MHTQARLAAEFSDVEAEYRDVVIEHEALRLAVVDLKKYHDAVDEVRAASKRVRCAAASPRRCRDRR